MAGGCCSKTRANFLKPVGLLAKAKRTLLPLADCSSAWTLALATSNPRIAKEEHVEFIRDLNGVDWLELAFVWTARSALALFLRSPAIGDILVCALWFGSFPLDTALLLKPQ